MGSSISIFFANCFMLSRHEAIISSPPRELTLFLRYIDDLFFMWRGDRSTLTNLLTTDRLVGYTFEDETNGSIPFLDVRITREGPTLRTSLYRKPTDGQQYLHYRSCHPLHTRTSIPYAQLCRFTRICSDPVELEREKAWLGKRLALRGYPSSVVSDAFARVPSPRIRQTGNCLRLIIPYHPSWDRSLSHMLTEFWTELKLLFDSDPGGSPLELPKPTVTFLRPETLGDIAGPAAKRTARILVSDILS